jgi:type IV pilus assembly protein PilM
MATNVCSLDISENQLKLIQLEDSGNGTFQLRAIAVADAEPTFFKSDQREVVNAQAGRIKSMIAQSGTRIASANVIIPDNVSYSRILEMPRLNEKELLSAIQYQADQFIPMALDEVNISIEVVYENKWSKKNLIMIVAAPHTVVNATETAVELAGILPTRIENEVSALGRLCQVVFQPIEDRPADTEGYIVVNMGHMSSSIYYYDQCKRAITYTHTFAIGYSLFLKELEINFNIPRSESRRLLQTSGALTGNTPNTGQVLLTLMKEYLQELEKSIAAIRQLQSRINGIYLINAAVEFQALDRLIAKYTELPCQMLDLLPFITYESPDPITGAQLAHFIIASGAQMP